MTTQVMSSAFHEEENNMEKITDPKDTVWKCNKTHKYAKGEKSPFSSTFLTAFFFGFSNSTLGTGSPTFATKTESC